MLKFINNLGDVSCHQVFRVWFFFFVMADFIITCQNTILVLQITCKDILDVFFKFKNINLFKSLSYSRLIDLAFIKVAVKLKSDTSVLEMVLFDVKGNNLNLIYFNM